MRIMFQSLSLDSAYYDTIYLFFQVTESNSSKLNVLYDLWGKYAEWFKNLRQPKTQSL